MSVEEVVEYRAVWPNGDEVWPAKCYTNRMEFFEDFDDLVQKLGKLAVPGEGHPRVECRRTVVTKTTTEWELFGEFERKAREAKKAKHVNTMPLTTSGPEYVNQGPIEPPQTSWVPTLEWQIEQVANHRFRFTDPCIVCGGAFTSCGHTSDDTQALISRIKRDHNV